MDPTPIQDATPDPVRPDPSPPQGLNIMAIPPPVAPTPGLSKVEPANMQMLLYDPMSGRITINATVPTVEVGNYLNRNTTMLLNKNADPALYWVSGGELLARPDNPTVLNGLVLSAIPTDSHEPATLEITGSRGVSTLYPIAGETTVTLAFPNPGQYVAKVSCFPYKPAFFPVTV